MRWKRYTNLSYRHDTEDTIRVPLPLLASDSVVGLCRILAWRQRQRR
jgi:hypothetical protein